MKTFLLSLCLVSAMLAGNGQSELKQILPGQRVPPIRFLKTVNHSNRPILLNELKGKLIILDFWNAYCSNCLAAFPHLRKLQDRFGDKLFILPVGFDFNDGDIENLVNKRKGTAREIPFPIAIQSSQQKDLTKLFPFDGVPHEVWIHPDGTFLAATDASAVTEGNIQAIFDGRPPPFKEYRRKTKVNACDDFLLTTKGLGADRAFGSILTGYIDTVAISFRFGKQCDSNATRLMVANETVHRLYRYVFGEHFNGPQVKKWMIFGGDGKPFYRDIEEMGHADNWTWEEFKRNNFFCYELRLPSVYSLEDAKAQMKMDLDRYFSVSSSVDSILRDCLVLVDFDSLSTPGVCNDKSAMSEYMEDGLEVHFRNATGREITDFLNIPETDVPILDETSPEKKYCFDLTVGEPFELEKVRRQLAPYGLKLINTKRLIPMVILKQLSKFRQPE